MSSYLNGYFKNSAVFQLTYKMIQRIQIHIVTYSKPPKTGFSFNNYHCHNTLPLSLCIGGINISHHILQVNTMSLV